MRHWYDPVPSDINIGLYGTQPYGADLTMGMYYVVKFFISMVGRHLASLLSRP